MCALLGKTCLFIRFRQVHAKALVHTSLTTHIGTSEEESVLFEIEISFRKCLLAGNPDTPELLLCICVIESWDKVVVLVDFYHTENFD